MSKTILLLAIPEMDRGGPDRVFLELLMGLDCAKFDLHLVVTSRQGEYLKKVPSYVKMHVIRRPWRWWQRYPSDGLLYLALKLRPDVLLTTLRMNFTANLIYGFLPSKTVLVTRIANDLTSNRNELVQVGVKQRLAMWLNKSLMHRADGLIAQSEYMAKDLVGQLDLSPPVVVLYNPISRNYLESYVSGKSKDLIGIPSLISVGRLMPQKGHDVLIRAMVEVVREFPNTHLTIIGDGPLRRDLEALINQLGLGSSITLAGFSSNPLPLVKSSDLFVLASRYEGFSNATLEAIALGTPVVVTDSPGANREMIREGLNGYLCRLEDSHDLADKIMMALNTKWDRSFITDNCISEYGSQRIISEYEAYLQQLAGEADR